MAKFMGAGGVVWDMDVPAEGTEARERFDAQVVNGQLVPVDVPSPEAPAKKAPAKKAATPKAEG